ncbi:MAG: hypothetical protein K1V75_05175 [Muribaculaceae bacterium]
MKRYNRLYGHPAIKAIVRPAVCVAGMVCASLAAMASGSIEHTVRYNYADLTVRDVEVEDGAVYSEINMPEMGNIGDTGAPALPVHHICFLVPSYSTDFSVTLLSGGEEKSITLPNELIPVQDIEYMNSAGTPFTFPDREKYSSSSDKVEVRVEGDNFFEGWQHFVTVSIRPVTYNSTARQIVCYNDIQVRLDYRECTAAEMPSPPVFPPEPRYSPLLTEFVVNPPMSDISGANRASSSYQSVNDRYIIVTTDDLKADFEKLAVWKRQKGYTAEVVTMESILSTPGYAVNPADSIWDEAAALRKWLKWRYQKDGHYFLLLAGDSQAGKMPVRKYNHNNFTGSDAYHKYYIPSDIYFVDFSQEVDNLQKLSNGLYTKSTSASMNPSLPVGRLMCRDSREVNNYFRKLILYESWPGKGDTQYLAWGFGFTQEDGITRQSKNISMPLSSYISFEWMKDTVRINDFNLRTPTGSQVINAMKNVGLMSWQGHGQPGSIGCAGKQGASYWKTWRYIQPTVGPIDTGLSHIDPDNSLDLLGNDYSPAVAYSLSCTIMPFDFPPERGVEYNMGTSFTVAGRYGGVALLGNTREGHWTNSGYIESFFGEYLKSNRKIGIAELLSRIMPSSLISGNEDRHTNNLLGDPEFEVWLGVPKDDKYSIINSSTSYTISGTNLKGCVVTSYNGKSIIRSDYVVQPLSKVTFDIGPNASPSSNNDLLISVWKTGSLPFFKLCANNVRLLNVTKTYSLPYVDIKQTSNNICKFIILTGATLNLLSATDIQADNAFTISGGILNLEGEAVKLTGSNSFRNGRVQAKADCLTLDGNFFMENCTLEVPSKW